MDSFIFGGSNFCGNSKNYTCTSAKLSLFRLYSFVNDISQQIHTNLFYTVCHAELNAVLNKNSADVKNCTIYVALFPCNECAKIVIQAGIKEVVYYSDKYHTKPEFEASRKMLDLAGVVYRSVIISLASRQREIIFTRELWKESLIFMARSLEIRRMM